MRDFSVYEIWNYIVKHKILISVIAVIIHIIFIITSICETFYKYFKYENLVILKWQCLNYDPVNLHNRKKQEKYKLAYRTHALKSARFLRTINVHLHIVNATEVIWINNISWMKHENDMNKILREKKLR